MLKKAVIWLRLMSEIQKLMVSSYFANKWRADTVQAGLAFDNFRPRLKSSIFKCTSWLNSFFFSGVSWLRFSERGSQDLSNGMDFANFFSVFTSIVYNLIRYKENKYKVLSSVDHQFLNKRYSGIGMCTWTELYLNLICDLSILWIWS